MSVILGWLDAKEPPQPCQTDPFDRVFCRSDHGSNRWSMALLRRGFPKETVLHSAGGSQDCSQRYQRLMESNGLHRSRGRRATCYDNGGTESFFHTRKVELVYRAHYLTRRMTQSSILSTSQ